VQTARVVPTQAAIVDRDSARGCVFSRSARQCD